MAEGPGPDVGGPAGHSHGAGASSKRLALAAWMLRALAVSQRFWLIPLCHDSKHIMDCGPDPPNRPFAKPGAWADRRRLAGGVVG